MTKLQDELRAVKVFNDYEFFRGSVYLDYRPAEEWQTAAWQVVRPGFQTDSKGHWQDRGHKTFAAWGGREGKAAAFEEAKAWATERYGLSGEWKRGPFGGYGDAEFVKARLKELRDQRG